MKFHAILSCSTILIHCLLCGYSLAANDNENGTIDTPEGTQPPKRMKPDRKCFVQQPINLGPRTSCPANSNYRKLSELVQAAAANQEGAGASNMADLILSRSGIFDWSSRDLDQLYVCDHHYKKLGEEWANNEPVTGRAKNWLCNFPPLLVHHCMRMMSWVPDMCLGTSLSSSQ